jgi:hypothetical protein
MGSRPFNDSITDFLVIGNRCSVATAARIIQKYGERVVSHR